MHKKLLILVLATLFLLRRPRHRNHQSSTPTHGAINTSSHSLHSPFQQHFPSVNFPLPFNWPASDPSEHRRMVLPRSLLISPLMNHILIAPSIRVLYCPIPGTVSFTEYLASANGAPLRQLSEFSIRDRERFLLRPDVFRFVFVLHPFTRLLASFYRGTRGTDGIHGTAYRGFMAKVRGRALDHGEHELQMISFQFLLSSLARTSALHEEFQAQTDLCGFEFVSYDFVGRVETLSQDAVVVNKNVKTSLVSLSADAFVREASKDMPHVFHSHRMRTRAARLYANDLQKLLYSVDFG